MSLLPCGLYDSAYISTFYTCQLCLLRFILMLVARSAHIDLNLLTSLSLSNLHSLTHCCPYSCYSQWPYVYALLLNTSSCWEAPKPIAAKRFIPPNAETAAVLGKKRQDFSASLPILVLMLLGYGLRGVVCTMHGGQLSARLPDAPQGATACEPLLISGAK